MNLEPLKYTGSILRKEVCFKYTAPQREKWMSNGQYTWSILQKRYTWSVHLSDFQNKHNLKYTTQGKYIFSCSNACPYRKSMENLQISMEIWWKKCHWHFSRVSIASEKCGEWSKFHRKHGNYEPVKCISHESAQKVENKERVSTILAAFMGSQRMWKQWKTQSTICANYRIFTKKNHGK